MRKQHFGLLDQTVPFFQQINHLCVIVTSFKGEHAFQAPSVVSSEVETHSHKNVRVKHSKSFDVSSQPRWVYDGAFINMSTGPSLEH